MTRSSAAVDAGNLIPMSRTALARAYRPRRFSEVATQEHVSATLRTAVQRDRVAHAYLFCGPRGVGKTTLARVLAMALNCPSRTAEGEPCGVCDSCERIWAGRTSLDVVEIDAASNRGVDDARDLRERAMYAPSEHDRFKVYIIDEAHMLTREAWNALLKILEEPPPRVIFVFATTEPQKIQQAAPPILSRC
jgi:DNA polymerase III subunit gamma/tau